MAKKKIADYIRDWMEYFGQENGYELSRSEFVRSGENWYLRVYVDKLVNGDYGYLSTDDCEKISRFLSAKLDEEDPIKQNYYLEVSSPGLDRLLVSDKDFDRFKGQLVDVSLYEAINGSKHLTAELVNKENGEIVILTDKKETIRLPEEKTASVRLAVTL